MESKRFLTGSFVAGLGLVLVLLAADIISQSFFQINVPNGVLIILGFVLISGGSSVFVTSGSAIASRLVSISLMLFSLIFFWIAFFGDLKHMGGGIPFIPSYYNGLIGRLAFGIGGLCFLFLSISAWRYAKHTSKVEEDEDETAS